MASFTKQEQKSAKEAYNKVIKLHSNLERIENEKVSLEGQVLQYHAKLQEEVATKNLDDKDIESINIDKEGIRIATLKNAGINYVGQLYGKTASEIQKINGIGEAMAEKICENVRLVYLQCLEEASVVISIDKKSPSMNGLIKSLSDILVKQQAFERVDLLYQKSDSFIEQYGQNAKLLCSPLKWTFAAKSKKESAIIAGKEFEKLLQEDFENQAELAVKEYQSSYKKKILNPWKAFEDNSAPFYALLETILENASGSKEEVTFQKNVKGITGGSPITEELIKSITAYPLQLDLLNANLRRYQIFGTQYILHQEKVLLGDEMGLGKTMQAIAAMCHLAMSGGTHFLVICPLSVVVNWTREIANNSSLQVMEIYGDDRNEEMEAWIATGGVAITTYETLNRVMVPEGSMIDFVVVDEAHYIKNPAAQRTQSVVRVLEQSKKVLLMSGTPLENKVEEMQFLIRCLRPDIYEEIKYLKQLGSAKSFKEKIAPVYLRRVREDVLKELPELLEKEQWGILNKNEIVAYEKALVSDNFMQARQVSWNVEDLAHSSKASRLLEICEEAKEGNRKLIIFSFFKDTLLKVATLLGEDCVGIIDGSVPSGERQEMIDALAKAPAGSSLVCQILAGGVGLNIQAASVVIFCEPQMKPSLETQAVARAYRMGQSRSVVVHRLLMEKTVDEEIMELLHRKTEIFDNFADDSVVGQTKEASTVDEYNDEKAVKLNEKMTANKIMDSECKRRGIIREKDNMGQ
ncbi:MAG: DEAD/DEAH box helicase [Lachnospiraceae bacterium]